MGDATLPGNCNNKHMTILYRKRPKWTESEIELISRETDLWLKQKYGNNKAPVTFTINKWGNQSCKINGKKDKNCHICGESGHYKKHCPQKQNYKNSKKCNKKFDKFEEKKNNEKKCKNGNEKIKIKLQKMIAKTNTLKNVKKSE